ncbi:EpsG family protein [Klebsiella sp. RHBSTW-00465]|uniref:EpsG family protein n=1 Tax=Klebsiella sp. RHBSTW-00465 TaxID=2742650 RepID=UPI0015F69D9F|nr:EpsG family protein [Klebsiella sp. RHBSTW-00465]MBA7847945.1 EpsG family protein [Klebsiella sp. RHBSTW-00465]
MELYITTVVLSFILSIIGVNAKAAILKKCCLLLIVLLCSIMPGLRDISVGTDSPMYANFLLVDRSYHDWLVSGIAIEPGFVFLIKIYQFFGFKDYSYFFFGTAILFNFLVISSIFKLSPSPTLSLISFLTFSTIYFSHFNVLRSSLALAFFIYSIPYLLNKQYKKCYILIFISIFFHISALIFLFMPSAYKYLRTKTALVIFISFVFMGVYSASSTILSLIGSIIGTTKYDSYSTESDIGGGFFAIYFLLMLICLISLSNNKLKNSDLYIFSVYMIFLATLTWFCIIFLGLRYEGPGRVVVYFYLGSIFIFPNLLQIFSPTSRYPLYFLLFFLFAMMAYYVFVLKGVYGVFPYKINSYLDGLFEFF